MTALSNTLAAQLARMLPMFSSDKQGDVVATAAAVTRKLQTEGCDWHDLAQHVVRPPETRIVYRDTMQSYGPQAYPFGSWRDASRRPSSNAVRREQVFRCQNASAGRLNEWEAGFLLSLSQQIAKGRPLSPKQVSILDAISDRFGVRT